MDEVADRYRRRADAFERLVAGTGSDRWSSPSPCDGWLARDIVQHVVGHSTQVLRDKAGVTPAEGPAVADDPLAAFRAVRALVERVVDDDATTPDVRRYLDGALSLDLPQHAWDLAKATGQDATMDPDELATLWAQLSGMEQGWWDWHRENGWYADAVPIADDAPLQDRLLGLIGRDPYWTPAGGGG